MGLVIAVTTRQYMIALDLKISSSSPPTTTLSQERPFPSKIRLIPKHRWTCIEQLTVKSVFQSLRQTIEQKQQQMRSLKRLLWGKRKLRLSKKTWRRTRNAGRERRKGINHPVMRVRVRILVASHPLQNQRVAHLTQKANQTLTQTRRKRRERRVKRTRRNDPKRIRKRRRKLRLRSLRSPHQSLPSRTRPQSSSLSPQQAKSSRNSRLRNLLMRWNACGRFCKQTTRQRCAAPSRSWRNWKPHLKRMLRRGKQSRIDFYNVSSRTRMGRSRNWMPTWRSSNKRSRIRESKVALLIRKCRTLPLL